MKKFKKLLNKIVKKTKPYSFDPIETKIKLVDWIREWFSVNGKDCNVVIGLSGGKDSFIVAALCAEALGKDRVIGVAMPDFKQELNGADEQAKYLGIRFIVAPIDGLTSSVKRIFAMEKTSFDYPWWFDMTKQTEQNVPPRIRMTMLRAIAQSNNGRISNNCNLSENYLGYFTIAGDGDGDFCPLANLTVTEIKQIGNAMGLPKEWVEKTPDDGLPCSSTDEVKFGFSYEVLDLYIRGIKTPPKDIKHKIDRWHKSIIYKLNSPEEFKL